MKNTLVKKKEKRGKEKLYRFFSQTFEKGSLLI